MSEKHSTAVQLEGPARPGSAIYDTGECREWTAQRRVQIWGYRIGGGGGGGT